MASQCCCRRMHAAAPSTAAQLQQAGRRVNQLACMPTIGEQLQQPGVLLGSHPPRNLQERGQAGGSLRERQSSVYPAPISHASCLPACLQGAFGSVPWQPVGSHIIVERDDQHASWQHKGEVGTLWLEVTTVCKISATWNSTHRWQERQQAACRHGGSLPHRQGRSSTAALARAILAGGRGGGRGGGGYRRCQLTWGTPELPAAPRPGTGPPCWARFGCCWLQQDPAYQKGGGNQG